MVDVFALIEKISKWGLYPLVIGIGVGSYFKIWTWYWLLQEEKVARAADKVEFEARLREAKATTEEYKQMLFKVTGIAEIAVNIAKKSG